MLRALGMGTQKNPGRVAEPGSVATTGGDSGKDATDLQTAEIFFFATFITYADILAFYTAY